MLLGDDFFFPVSKRSLASSEDVHRRGVDAGNTVQPEGLTSKNNNNINREGRVLGFDVFALHATKDGGEETQSDDAESFFPVPGLTWTNSPLSTGNEPEETSSAPKAAATIAASSGPPNVGVQILKNNSPLLPAWFPWVPTKSQIMTLKLKELREACAQRGLAKVGFLTNRTQRKASVSPQHSICGCMFRVTRNLTFLLSYYFFSRRATRTCCKTACGNGQAIIKCNTRRA
jgi:hypothetical protein